MDAIGGGAGGGSPVIYVAPAAAAGKTREAAETSMTGEPFRSILYSPNESSSNAIPIRFSRLSRINVPHRRGSRRREW
jgi:hypothetical protein